MKALDEAKRYLELEKTTHEIELQETLEKEAEVEKEKEGEVKDEEATDVDKGAVLPDSGRTVTPMTSLFMHRSIEHMEIGRLSVRKNELVNMLNMKMMRRDTKRCWPKLRRSLTT